MPFCSNDVCPLNYVNIVPETTGADLLASFFSCSHQPEAIFTPDQLLMVQNEIMFLIGKYNKARRVSMRSQRIAAPEIKCLNLSESKGFWEKKRSTAAATISAPSLKRRHSHSNDQKEYPNVSKESKDIPESSGTAASTQMPRSNESQSGPPFLAPSLFSVPSPIDVSRFLDISFRDIYSKTGSIGISKIAFLDKMSQAVSNPLGCCYDAALENWIIADTGNGRIMFFPGGFAISSKQNRFNNVRSLCVLEPGRSLAVLTETILGTFVYTEGVLSIIKENKKLNFRGLAHTPRGHLATIERTENSCDIVVYNVTGQDYGKIHAVINMTSDPNAIPSFVAMNGNRLVVTDIGTETLTLAVFSSDEKSAKIRRRRPLFPTGNNRQSNGFQFVSAVQMDRNGWIIVADTCFYALHLFDEELNFISSVGSNYTLPFIRTICINNAGNVLIIGQGDDGITISEMVSSNYLPSAIY